MPESFGSLKKINKVMALVLAFEGELARLICAHLPQSGRTLVKKHQFYDEMKDEWRVKNNHELV